MFARRNHSRRQRQSFSTASAEVLEERRLPTTQWLPVLTCPDDSEPDKETISDGMTYTLMVTETAGGRFSSPHTGGANFTLADGSVNF